MATVELNIIKQQSRKLLPKQKLELIKFLSESLAQEPNRQASAFLKFGKYSKTGRTIMNVLVVRLVVGSVYGR